MIAMLLNALLITPAAQAQAEPMRFDCAVALMVGPGQMTAPTPVSIRFIVEGKALSDIHVVDAGGILYPGGNMRMVEKPDALTMETVAVPAERPGQWRGVAERKTFRLTLTSGSMAKAVEIGIDRAPDKKTGRIGLVWNATNQPPGMPGPISGSGIGNCAISMKDSK